MPAVLDGCLLQGRFAVFREPFTDPFSFCRRLYDRSASLFSLLSHFLIPLRLADDNSTHGDVFFVNQSDSSDLAYYQESSDSVFIKVDTANITYPNKRRSVKFLSEERCVTPGLYVEKGCSLISAFSRGQLRHWFPCRL